MPKGERLGSPYGNLFVDTEAIVRERLADGLVLDVYSGRWLYPKDKVPHRDRGYLRSFDDDWNVPSFAETVDRLSPLCKAQDIRLFYSANGRLDPRLDGNMLTFAYPHAAELRIWDEAGRLSGLRFGFDGHFRVSAPASGNGAYRLVSKYGHSDATMRGWEIFVEKGRPVFRLRLVDPDGKASDCLVRSETTLPLARWTHLSATFDGAHGEAVLAVDGAKTTVKTALGARLKANPSLPVVFGAYAGGAVDSDVELMVDDVSFAGADGKTLLSLDFDSSASLARPTSVGGLQVEVRGEPPLVPGRRGKAWAISLDETTNATCPGPCADVHGEVLQKVVRR